MTTSFMRCSQAGQVYRWRMVQASTMKWMDLSMNGTGCTWGIYSRDGNFLRSFPRMTDHVVMSAANRCTLSAFTVADHPLMQMRVLSCMSIRTCRSYLLSYIFRQVSSIKWHQSMHELR